jgi:hypothetical protein
MTRTLGWLLALAIAVLIGGLLGSAAGGLYMVAGVGNNNYAVINKLTGTTWICLGANVCGRPRFLSAEEEKEVRSRQQQP